MTASYQYPFAPFTQQPQFQPVQLQSGQLQPGYGAASLAPVQQILLLLQIVPQQLQQIQALQQQQIYHLQQLWQIVPAQLQHLQQLIQVVPQQVQQLQQQWQPFAPAISSGPGFGLVPQIFGQAGSHVM